MKVIVKFTKKSVSYAKSWRIEEKESNDFKKGAVTVKEIYTDADFSTYAGDMVSLRVQQDLPGFVISIEIRDKCDAVVFSKSR